MAALLSAGDMIYFSATQGTRLNTNILLGIAGALVGAKVADALELRAYLT
jgi:uncharacterized membrane protein YeaQ/YmgE (transglycosylase-associated protein family)